MTQADDKTARPDLFLLSRAAGRLASVIGDLLDDDIANEARIHLSQGFIVPAPEVFQRAAGVFRHIAEMPGSGDALSAETEEDRVTVICALASAVGGMEEQIDLTWSSAWMRFREGDAATDLRVSGQVLAAWNGGQAQQLVERIRADRRPHYDQAKYER